MITTPNRLVGLVKSLESGEPVDYQRLATLQMVDLVIAGRQFVEEAITETEEQDNDAKQFLDRIGE